MTITEYAFKNKIVIYFILLLVLVGGITSYFSMGKLEDAVFTIKTALVVTVYPGASPHEVEQEVTEVVERAVMEMDNIKEIYSTSSAGLSVVQVDIEQALKNKDMPQQWDILRKKVKDATSGLPRGTHEPMVIDDFGDVYGMFYAVTSDGFSREELHDYAEYLKRELLTVDQVGEITLFGDRPECVDIKIDDAKISELGINPGLIIQALNAQTNVAPAGNIELSGKYARVAGNIASQNIDELRKTIIRVGNEQFYLGDIVEIKKSFIDPPQNLMYHNGSEAIGLAVSTQKGGNVLDLGENLTRKIEQLKTNLPVGIELTQVYSEAKEAETANKKFITNLIESVGIVVLVLLLFMGLRSGLLIGSGLIFSILGTILVMNLCGISMHRTSLSAIIVAMGMLVDNAIVVTDGALVNIQRGVNHRKAIIDISRTTSFPLLGATLIAVLAFLPVFIAKSNSAEINHDLFLVLAISLSLSWFFAMTQTAITNERFLKVKKIKEDPYDNRFYAFFKRFLDVVIKRKWLSVSVVVLTLFLAVMLFGKVKKAFFMPLDKSYTLIDYWLPEGTTIHKVQTDLAIAEKDLFKNLSEIKNITTSLNKTPPRYLLPAHNENYNTSFGQLMIETHSAEEAVEIRPYLQKYFTENFPDARVRIKGYISGPPIKYKVEARFMGPNPAVLRRLAEQAENIMHNEPMVGDITDNWRNQVLTWAPVYSPIKAKRAGITRSDLGNAIQRSTSSGLIIGMYRENDEKLPLVLKVDNHSLNNIESIENTGVWSMQGRTSVPLKEVVDSITIGWEDGLIQRYNQQRAITVQCDPADPNVTGATLLSLVRDSIESIPLPAGYSFMWAGEYKTSNEANASTRQFMPLAMLLVILIIIMLFNNVRQTIVVLLIIPLSVIGVAIGLFITNSAFGFMAIIGFMGLIGMVLKNAIVMMDQIRINMSKEGVDRYKALQDAAVNRLRPVFLAALTTMLGMLPLVTDSMFSSMAVTIIFGLLFATLLTLVVLPLLYAAFFKIEVHK
ncbi:efflux RND transporter permease subunit [Maribellus maritimus]|uniref:efflux RND transporter permease subunit n=1 Tax=Maribellus maritimus TaxID=2870838 RepID=UPI001EECA46A|nr:efflux RND transporter permease subunit [Maribellus maritimus]MCG6191155.1 efflux RND transporter permease subunit [Maribellus maritimus]